MKINEFCERLYEDKDKPGILPSVGVSREMRDFIEEQLTRANEEALQLKEDERERQADRFVPYHQITCDTDCMALFRLGPSMSTLERKDPRGILPTDVDQQYLIFYAWFFLAFTSFVVFVFYSAFPTSQDAFTLSCVLLVLGATSFWLLKDWELVLT